MLSILHRSVPAACQFQDNGGKGDTDHSPQSGTGNSAPHRAWAQNATCPLLCVGPLELLLASLSAEGIQRKQGNHRLFCGLSFPNTTIAHNELPADLFLSSGVAPWCICMYHEHHVSFCLAKSRQMFVLVSRARRNQIGWGESNSLFSSGAYE